MEEMIAHYEDTKSNTFFRETPQKLEEKREKGLCYKVEGKIMATRNSTPHNYKYGSVVSPSLPQPTRVPPQQLEKKEEKKGFVTIVIENTLKVISVLGRNYFTLIVERRKKRIKKHQNKSIYTMNQPQRKKK